MDRVSPGATWDRLRFARVIGSDPVPRVPAGAWVGMVTAREAMTTGMTACVDGVIVGVVAVVLQVL